MTDQTTPPWTPREQLPVEMARALQEAGAWTGREMNATDWVVDRDDKPSDSPWFVHNINGPYATLNRPNGDYSALHCQENLVLLPTLADLLQAMERICSADGTRRLPSLIPFGGEWRCSASLMGKSVHMRAGLSPLLACAECLLAILRRKEGATDV